MSSRLIKYYLNYNNYADTKKHDRNSDRGTTYEREISTGMWLKKQNKKETMVSGRTGATRGCVVYCVAYTIKYVPSDIPLSRFTATGRLASGEPRAAACCSCLLRYRAGGGIGRTGKGSIRGVRRRNRRWIIHSPWPFACRGRIFYLQVADDQTE